MSNPQLAEIDASLQAIVRRAYELGRGDALKKVVEVLSAEPPASERLALMAPDAPTPVTTVSGTTSSGTISSDTVAADALAPEAEAHATDTHEAEAHEAPGHVVNGREAASDAPWWSRPMRAFGRS